MSSQPTEESLAEKIRGEINRHGHAFQDAVLKACNGLRVHGFDSGEWLTQAREFPVALHGHELHIDGILEWRTTASPPGDSLFATLECKRVDPAFGCWCFAASTHADRELIAERYNHTPAGAIVAFVGQLSGNNDDIVNVGFELKHQQVTGNAMGRGFDKAVSQALRGAGGLARQLTSLLQRNAWARIVPVIVTTADLYVWATPLSEASLTNGDIAPGDARRVDRLWYDVNVSASLSPDVIRSELRPRFGSVLPLLARHQHRRAIAITTPEGLPDTLRAVAQQSFHHFQFVDE